MKLLIIFLLLFSIGNVCATDTDNFISPQTYINDSHFSLSNNGYLSYNVYMYSYVGGINYTDSFVGVLNQGEVIVLPLNANYNLYAHYDNIQDYTDTEKVKSKFNQYWFIVMVGIFILVVIILIIKRLIK